MVTSTFWEGNLARSFLGAVAHPMTNNRIRKMAKKIFVFIVVLLFFPQRLIEQGSETNEESSFDLLFLKSLDPF